MWTHELIADRATQRLSFDTPLRADQLRVGDFVQFGGELSEIIGLHGMTVIPLPSPVLAVVKASVLRAAAREVGGRIRTSRWRTR